MASHIIRQIAASERADYFRGGTNIYKHACALGCKGIVSKRLGYPYRSGRVNHWLKIKSPAAPAVKREAEEDWSDKRWARGRCMGNDQRHAILRVRVGPGHSRRFGHPTYGAAVDRRTVNARIAPLPATLDCRGTEACLSATTTSRRSPMSISRKNRVDGLRPTC
jgi:hypothetical protein